MNVITISRQMGSKGDELGRTIAEQLGWRCVGYEVINRAALAAGAPHVALAEIDELGFFGLKPSAKERQAYRSQVEQIICELADEGQVIIMGRAGQVILHDRASALHVRVVAPVDIRVAWLQQEKKFPAEEARICLTQSDRVRVRYLKQNYNQQLNDPALYHLIINTGLLGLSQSVQLITQVVQERKSHKF